jgi:hypothetical protein
LYTANLLSADIPPETEQLLRRGRDRMKQRFASQAIGLMYFRLRLFNPDASLHGSSRSSARCSIAGDSSRG